MAWLRYPKMHGLVYRATLLVSTEKILLGLVRYLAWEWPTKKVKGGAKLKLCLSLILLIY
jgi:hypothetical protein